MIDLEIDPQIQTAREMVRWLGRERLRPIGIEADRKDEPPPPDHPFFKEFMDLGLGGGMASELMKSESKKSDGRSGGADQSAAADKSATADKPKMAARLRLVAAEEAAYWDHGMAASFPGPGLATPPVSAMGTEEQKKRFFATYEDRTVPKWGAFALTEPAAGSDVAAIKTTCRKEGGDWILNGEKMFITNGARSHWSVVFATVDRTKGREGHRIFMVEKGTPGFRVGRIEKKMGIRSSETASLILEDCRVPAENLLGGEDYYRGKEGFKGAMGFFDLTRPGVGVMAIGVGRAAYEHAMNFVKENYMLGRPIPRYAKIKARLSRMRRRLEAGRLLCWRAAWMMDHGQPNNIQASMAKAFCPPVALEATRHAIEILSDAGVRQDYLAEKFFRDIKIFDIFEGTGQIQRIVIGKRLFGLPQSAG